MTYGRKLVLSVFAALAVALGGVGIAAAAPTAPAASTLPVGVYSDGTVLQCITTASPYYVKAHAGAKTASCPTGTRLLNATPRKGDTGPKGAQGAQGAIGATGLKGETGESGLTGETGENGMDGAQGPKGDKGDTGADGADGVSYSPTYGVAQLNIARGNAAAATWAEYSTSIGSPVGDSASTTIRMTCSTAKAPCFISTSARSTDGALKAYPRLLITRENIDTAKPEGTCEYADGVDNEGGFQSVGIGGSQLDLGIGGSLDCGTDQVRPSTGIVSEIKVGAGYYNITATTTFKR